MIAHIYPLELHAVSGRGYAGCLDVGLQGYRGEAVQDPVSELRRTPIPRTWVNKGHEDRAWIPVSPESPSDTNLMPYCGVGHPCDCSDTP